MSSYGMEPCGAALRQAQDDTKLSAFRFLRAFQLGVKPFLPGATIILGVFPLRRIVASAIETTCLQRFRFKRIERFRLLYFQRFRFKVVERFGLPNFHHLRWRCLQLLQLGLSHPNGQEQNDACSQSTRNSGKNIFNGLQEPKFVLSRCVTTSLRFLDCLKDSRFYPS